MLRRWSFAASAAVACLSISGTAGFGQDEAGTKPRGFAADTRVEAFALGVPTPEKARAWLRTLTEEPHVAGTPADHKTALFVRDKLREWGWQADLAEYEVLLNYPTGMPTLDLIQPNSRSLPVFEAPIARDKDSASRDAFPAFHGYGVSGEVAGQVVYANYGRPEDFATLERLGIDVKDRIVLVRYGELFRGLKVRNAQKRGARGVLIYSDPADDGYAKGDPYPDGPFRPGSAIQRGSVQFLSLGPGDPSTPGTPSVKGARRLPFHVETGFPLGRFDDEQKKALNKDILDTYDEKVWESATGLKRIDYFATIPSLPISYDAARPILAVLAGPNVPSGWQGGLPLAYHVGPGPAEVRFKTWQDYKVRPVWNVIAKIRGEVEPDRWVLVGNHRDAWVYGAVDPGSGTAATLEMCRALGAAVKNGWKPRRTLVYASWDAEEYGLVGSTEWVEEHAGTLDERAVMLLNVDSAVSGPDLDVDGIPSLRDLVLDAARSIHDVRTGRPLHDLWVEKRRTAWLAGAPLDVIDPLWDLVSADIVLKGSPPRRFTPQMNWLGSGSDYTAFVDHLGIPALDVGFSGRYGVYHSIYDNFTWMERFGDPEFLTHATAAKLYTLIAIRAASAEIVPFTFVPYGEALREHIDDLRRLVARRGARVPASPNNHHADGTAAPAFEGLARLVKAVRAFQDQASALDRATEALANRKNLAPTQITKVNDALTRIERAFLLPNGLPGRSWFRHAVYAPGLTTGYASWPLPGIRQALQDNDAEILATQLPAVVERLDAATEAMKAATEAATAPAEK
jgi:N-acetylated-alpha-linked acidic dipeptidase